MLLLLLLKGRKTTTTSDTSIARRTTTDVNEERRLLVVVGIVLIIIIIIFNKNKVINKCEKKRLLFEKGAQKNEDIFAFFGAIFFLEIFQLSSFFQPHSDRERVFVARSASSRTE